MSNYDPRQQRPSTPPQWQQGAPPRQYQPPQPQQYPYHQALPPVFPPGYSGQPDERGYWPPPQPPERRKPDKRTVTVQSGSNGFHLFMTVITGGLWLLVWPLFRRKVRVTTKYR